MPDANAPPVRRLTHEQAKQEERVYWAGKTIAERLAAMTALNERMRRMRGIVRDEQAADFTVSRVSGRKG